VDAPTAGELEAHPVVRAAMATAWADSFPDDPTLRHEEGGWIYMNVTSGEVTVRRAPPGERDGIDLSNPVAVSGCVVVGVYHTHPNPTALGWNPEPSPHDRFLDARRGVPDLIASDVGVFHSGPPSRRGGLAGPLGYPS
jgi:hypothetical protein